MYDTIRLLRVPHYVKNLFIFMPLFFAARITEVPTLFRAFLAFIAFSAVASAVYIFNDLRDIAEDRLHPTKKDRPLASGAVATHFALAVMAALILIGLTASWFIHPGLFQIVLFYAALNGFYAIKLKHVPIIDIFIVALGFVIRVFVGGVVTDTRVSMWIVVMTFLLALFIALGKRRDDILILLREDKRTRKALDGYNLQFIDSAMIIMAAVTIVAYIMFTTSTDVLMKFHSDKLYVTTLFVVLGIMRYMQIIFVEENASSPTTILIRDRFIQLSIVGWLCLFGFIIYR